MNAVDINVLIYACDKRNPAFQKRALELVNSLGDSVLLWKVACEFIAASRKLADQGFTPDAAWRRLSEFLDLMPLRIPNAKLLGQTRGLHVEQQWSYWDALLVAASMEAGVTRLYSEDLPGHLPPDGLENINPFT